MQVTKIAQAIVCATLMAVSTAGRLQGSPRKPLLLLHQRRRKGPLPLLGAPYREALAVGRHDDRPARRGWPAKPRGIGSAQVLEDLLLAAGNGPHRAARRIL